MITSPTCLKAPLDIAPKNVMCTVQQLDDNQAPCVSCSSFGRRSTSLVPSRARPFGPLATRLWLGRTTPT